MYYYYYYYLCGMRIDNFLKNLTIEELIEVQSKSSGIIHDYKDGYFYILGTDITSDYGLPIVN